MQELYRIWHASQPQGARRSHIFNRNVSSVEEALLVLDVLAKYDLFLPDDTIVANAQGLEISRDGGDTWEEWEDEWGDDICEVMRNE